jgi:3-hydroxyacyl-[acyl-carrier-protein] dehydratase
MMDFEEIRRLLPQQPPLLMIDRVLDLVPGERITAVKNVSGNEWFFQAHFPQAAVMPAALILEALAQATILLQRGGGGPPAEPDAVFLFGSVRAKMHRVVLPGDVLRLEVKLIRMFAAGGAAEGVASVDGRPCVEAEMYFSKVRVGDLRR